MQTTTFRMKNLSHYTTVIDQKIQISAVNRTMFSIQKTWIQLTAKPNFELRKVRVSVEWLLWDIINSFRFFRLQEKSKDWSKARFKRRILHAPNRIAKLTACKMRRLNQLNATHFNLMRVSRIFDWSSRICDWTSTVDLNAAFYMCRIELKLSWIIYVCSNENLKHVTRAQQFYSAKQCDV